MGHRGLSLGRTFALLSLIIIALITAVQVAVQWSLLKEDLLAWERTVIADGIAATVHARLRPDDLRRWQEPDARERLDRAFGSILAQREIRRVKVYDAEARVVWSDEPRLLGTRFADNAHLAAALRGIAVARLERALKAENLYERHLGESVELYVPLALGAGRPVGVVEIYKSPAPALANLSRDRWTIVGTSLLGALVLWAGLFGIVHRASRQLAAQRRNLEQQAAALEASNRELRATQDQLRAAERLAAVGEVSAAVAHGLKNPLASIRAMAQVALDGPADRAGTDRYLRAIMIEVDRLGRWLRHLLQFVRPFEPRLGPVDLNAVVEEALAALEDRAARGHVKLERYLAADLPLLQADEAQLQQALLGVLENALDALPAGGSIRVHTEATGPATRPVVRVTIHDSGAGIPLERQQRLFEPFFTTKSEGTGLGLAITRKVAEGHGGAVSLESAPGRGTTVTLTLPVAPAALGRR